MCNILKPVCIPTYFALLLMSMSASAYADTINDTQLKILRGDRKLGDRGRFGRLVCMSGDHAIIGAHSIYAPYVFMRGGDAWIEQAKLREDDSYFSINGSVGRELDLCPTVVRGRISGKTTRKSSAKIPLM